MSKTSSPTDALTLEGLLRVFGDANVTPAIDRQAMAAADVSAHVRGLITAAIHQDKVSLTELAQRLGVTKAVVAGQLNADGNMRLSTMALFAQALGRRFDIVLHPKVE